ncbi:MAG: peptidoglycan DD-metalloendopeptidase family protein [Actinomycetes bacterium]
MISPPYPPGRLVAFLALGGLLLSLLGVAPVAAQDLEDQRERVEKQIEQGAARLEHSSSRLVAATRRQEAAEAELAAARADLAATRAELGVAQARDTRMQEELAAAVIELRAARADLRDSRGRLVAQERRLGRIALQSQQTGDPALLALSSVLSSEDAVELGGQLGSAQSVLDKEASELQRLEAARVLHEVQRERLAEARTAVARRRAAAAENLRAQQELTALAEVTASRMEGLVAERSAARAEAEEARAEDARQVEALESERDRIGDLLRQRAAEARAAARRAAREAAREAARAAAAARVAAREEARQRAREATRQRARHQAEAAERARERVSHAAPARVSTSGLAQPVDGYLTSSYGMRLHPVYKRWSLHDGTDFGAACGTPVRAAASGTVVEAYSHSAYGKRVIIDHGYQSGVGLATAYNHLSGYSTYGGQRVERGEVIGYVGSTGYSTGCHLHFMVFENGSTVNPMNWL